MSNPQVLDMGQIRQNYNLVNYAVLFSFIDMLFIPRLMYPVAIPISMLFMLIICFSFKYKKENIVIAFIFIVSIILTLNYSLLLGGEYITDNIKRALQFISFFSYLIVAYRAKYNINYYVWIIRIFFAWIFILSILFILNPAEVISVISRIYPESVYIQDSNLINLRFSYIFQDPNGAGYFYSMIFVCYLIIEKNWKVKYLFLFLFLFSLLMTQSRGAILSAFCFLIVIFIFDRKYLPKYFYVIPLILVPIVIYYIMQLDDVMNIFKMLESRGDNESSLGGGRYYKYIYMLDNFNFKPFGIGYNITVNDVIFKPHSDFIMLVLSYGIIVLVIFFYMICPRIKEQAYLFIPFIFGFLINSILDEYRLICVFFILTGLLYENYKVQKRDKI